MDEPRGSEILQKVYHRRRSGVVHPDRVTEVLGKGGEFKAVALPNTLPAVCVYNVHGGAVMAKGAAKAEMVRAWVDPELKRQAEAALAAIGLTPSTAVTLLYKYIAAGWRLAIGFAHS